MLIHVQKPGSEFAASAFDWKMRFNRTIKPGAESVCWLVCERLGIKNPSAEYLSGYLDNNENIPVISIDTVLKSASKIEKMIKETKAPRKEIIVER